ncbi:chromatin modification-related protein EAF5 [Kluyveromyces marxianus DMKU3-1042]|uniref:Chromatin modification-related protein EAF5 n=1 Tax=Kluyveromyces marxianus (strain DMKU3-1042 / BCC 29191 / NBRC 104275) TaxID=1003335 RepID=W0T7V8_KLUMD|nr:chromatin modification-related protein EAF5 [Kluyveromyces marxianus DMKU3-1042]BAO38184.1 chromatin modification-related protein EAF5 [Kluyveromyces marxianus DMKU3-1042]
MEDVKINEILDMIKEMFPNQTSLNDGQITFYHLQINEIQNKIMDVYERCQRDLVNKLAKNEAELRRVRGPSGSNGTNGSIASTVPATASSSTTGSSSTGGSGSGSAPASTSTSAVAAAAAPATAGSSGGATSNNSANGGSGGSNKVDYMKSRRGKILAMYRDTVIAKLESFEQFKKVFDSFANISNNEVIKVENDLKKLKTLHLNNLIDLQWNLQNCVTNGVMSMGHEDTEKVLLAQDELDMTVNFVRDAMDN